MAFKVSLHTYLLTYLLQNADFPGEKRLL